MKFLISSLIFVSAANAQASSSLVFPLNNRATAEITWLGNGIDESEAELAWDNKGQQNLFLGNVCFKGRRTEVTKVLESLSEDGFLGQRLHIINIRDIGQDQMSYQIYNESSRRVLQNNVISRCC